MGKEVDKDAAVKILSHIAELKKELCELQGQNFPINQTALFKEKCKNFCNVLGVSGPNLKLNLNDGIRNFAPMKDAQEEILNNFDEYTVWLDGLAYRITLIADISPKEVSKIQKQLELEGQIPGLFKARWGVKDK